MIVKFHARGKGNGSGPVDYLLGKERNREGAEVLQGKPEEIRELIDASPYAKKYTSGVLSFAEADLPAGLREKVMTGFERVLMPGLDKDQYSILWVEHRDKGRLELNFLIPNTELLTGKRLQPYFDRADRPRIDAWQTLINGQIGLHDPNAPENKRTLVMPSNLPEIKQKAAEAITDGLVMLCKSEVIKNRHDVIQALTEAGFEVVRTTKSSISITDPDGGKNIRLKGAIYEQSFEAGNGLREEIERAVGRYRAHAEARLQRAREVCKRGIEIKCEENQQRHKRPQPEPEQCTGKAQPEHDRCDAVEQKQCTAYDRANMADYQSDNCTADFDVRRCALVSGRENHIQPGRTVQTARSIVETERENVGCFLPQGKGWSVSCDAERNESTTGMDYRRREIKAECSKTGERVTADDRTGKTITERVRAVTAGLLAKAGQLGERLRGIAEDVWCYAKGQRETERAVNVLESAGGELKQATQAFESVVKSHEMAVETERHRVLQEQRQKELVIEREYHGPSL